MAASRASAAGEASGRRVDVAADDEQLPDPCLAVPVQDVGEVRAVANQPGGQVRDDRGSILPQPHTLKSRVRSMPRLGETVTVIFTSFGR
jgi:hypothetical protein